MAVVVDLIVRRKEETVLGDVKNLNLKVCDRIIVEIDEAFEVGLVVSKERLIEKPRKELYKIIRK